MKKLPIYGVIDTKLYITYDQFTGTYIVTGKREEFEEISQIPYKLRFECATDVLQFINVIIGDRVNITMYNYNNLLHDFADTVTYQSFAQDANEQCEMVIQDNIKLSKPIAKDLLDILKYSFNYDNNMDVF